MHEAPSTETNKIDFRMNSLVSTKICNFFSHRIFFLDVMLKKKNQCFLDFVMLLGEILGPFPTSKWDNVKSPTVLKKQDIKKV